MQTRRRNQTDLDVGRRVRMRRLEQGISQTQLGKALGISFQQIQKYEKGANRIAAGRLEQIASLLKVPVSYFFGPLQGVSKKGQPVFDFLESAYSLRLLKAFARIKEKDLQLAVLTLVELMARK